MTCDCLDKLYEHYNKEILGGICFTNTATMVNVVTGKTTIYPPPLRFRYSVIGKNGKPTKKTRTSYIHANYCQFCGNRYE